jgi:hypothetical protein
MSKQTVDQLVNKWVSRKLLVFIIACIGLFRANLTSEDWVIIASIYIGSESVISIVERLSKFKQSNSINNEY